MEKIAQVCHREEIQTVVLPSLESLLDSTRPTVTSENLVELVSLVAHSKYSIPQNSMTHNVVLVDDIRT